MSAPESNQQSKDAVEITTGGEGVVGSNDQEVEKDASCKPATGGNKGTGPAPEYNDGPSEAVAVVDDWMASRDIFVVGLTGPFGSGCSTFAHYLNEVEPKYTIVRVSAFLRDRWVAEASPTVKRVPKDAPRNTLQRMGDELRRDEGNEALVRRALAHVLARPAAQTSSAPTHLVIDAIRNLGELRWLREQLGERFALFALYADTETRFARTSAGYANPESFYGDDLRDQGEEEMWGQQVGRCVDLADVLIPNATQLSAPSAVRTFFLGKIGSYLPLVEGRAPRAPTDQEVLMNIAFSAAHGSLCLKRQVGAVIALGKEPLATGYNENSTGIKPCIEEFGYCFRDEYRLDRFKELAGMGANCPFCNAPIPDPVLPPWVCECGQSLERVFFPERAMSKCTALHAEERAIINSRGQDLRGTTLYTTTSPCMLCAEKIIHAGIASVVYVEVYSDFYGLQHLKRGRVAAHVFEGVRSQNFNRYFAGLQAANEKLGAAQFLSVVKAP